MASDTCPPMDSGVGPASGDGGDTQAGPQCGGSGTAVVASTHGSFELHSVLWWATSAGEVVSPVTSATDPNVPRVAFPAGHIEGRFSFQADGCTTASGTFSTPYCEQACVQN